MIAVTFALPVESKDFVERLAKRSSVSHDGIETTRGEISGLPIVVVHTGVGGKACQESIDAFLKREPVDYLVSGGLAGALDPELNLGDLLIAQNFSSAELLESSHLRLDDMLIYFAPIVTVAAIVESKAERETLAKETGAAAVDMETEFIAKSCNARGVPMMSLRAISDSVAEPFPAPARVLFDVEKQKTPTARLALYLATHPAAVGRLKKFSARIAEARARLTDALLAVLREKLI
jgi:nucleoside phosphorylase